MGIAEKNDDGESKEVMDTMGVKDALGVNIAVAEVDDVAVEVALDEDDADEEEVAVLVE